MTPDVMIAHYDNPSHARDLIKLLDVYARDAMGGGEAFTPAVADSLVPKLAALPYAFSVLAYIEQEAVGMANCFESFSTFNARPIVNIHDIVVAPKFRGRGIGLALLECIERRAREKDCCKLTLEVLSNNGKAQALYRRFGFESYQLDPTAGTALFWHKGLDK